MSHRAGDVLRRAGVRLRKHWKLGVAALLLFIFVLGPGFTASQPEFYKRFERLSAFHDTWATSTHSNVNCQSCHVGAPFVSRALYGVRMTGEIYLALLPLDREPTTLTRPTNESCDACHIDLRTVSPSGDLRIPHKAHVDLLKIACVTCHDEMVHLKDPAADNAPKMETCLKCHDGKNAKAECEACHTDKGLPDSHNVKDWLVVHSTPESQGAEDCKACHAWTDNWCADCHARRPKSHSGTSDKVNWRKLHRENIEVRRNCEACHDAPFCVKCHGEVPVRNLNPALMLVR